MGTYTLTESNGPTGYTQTNLQCSGATLTGNRITLANGDSATCTFTNNDVAPQLTVIKTVVNDNGGTAVASAWTMNVTATNPSNAAFAGAASPGTTITINAGAFSVAESGGPATGYTQTSAVGCAGTAVVGGTYTCTITNNDVAPSLQLVKQVINSYGGLATPANFTLTANGGAAGTLSGVGPTVASGATFKAGTYALSELGAGAGASGYGSSGYNCTKNGGTPTALASIQLAVGDRAVCRIVNNDLPATLIVKKAVINDQGGTKIATNFAFSVNGGTAIGFIQDGGNTLAGMNTLTLNAGTYNVTEGTYFGYTSSYAGCANIQIANGGSATCTITNNDTGGTIVVIKNATPAQGSFAFTTTGTGYTTGFTLTGATTNNGNRNSTSGLSAGTYTALEATQLGWLLTGIGGSTDVNTPYDCVVTGSGGSTGAGNLNTQTATISLKNGDTVTCTFENTGNGATRTQGFWATHPELAQIAWFGGSAFGHTFPGVASVASATVPLRAGARRTVGSNDISKLMGGFWSDIAKTAGASKGDQRLDQSRMQLLQQLLAAELNASAFGSAPSGGPGQFASLGVRALRAPSTGDDPGTPSKGLRRSTAAGDSSTFTPWNVREQQVSRGRSQTCLSGTSSSPR